MYCIDHDAVELIKFPYLGNLKKIEIEDDFLSETVCNELVKCILKLPHIPDNLTHETFDENAKHFSIIFNKYSKHEFLKSSYNLKPIYDIFEKIKLPNTNAYFFNPNIMDASNIIFNENKKGIQHHYDAGSIRLKDENGRVYAPIFTVILYIKVPKTFIGGILRMHEFPYLEYHSPYEIKVRPKLGRKVIIRGDMKHAVSPLYSEHGEQRISLAFDQYNIPENRLNEVYFNIDT
jgi:hypothetical protein